MKLTSTSFKDGDYLGKDHVLSTDYGFGCSPPSAPRSSSSGSPGKSSATRDTADEATETSWYPCCREVEAGIRGAVWSVIIGK